MQNDRDPKPHKGRQRGNGLGIVSARLATGREHSQYGEGIGNEIG
jgi:hypothetical protein